MYMYNYIRVVKKRKPYDNAYKYFLDVQSFKRFIIKLYGMGCY